MKRIDFNEALAWADSELYQPLRGILSYSLCFPLLDGLCREREIYHEMVEPKHFRGHKWWT